MTTFADSQDQFIQQHFTIVELDLPVVEGVCTVSGLPGYGTPLSCDQASNATRTYKFCIGDAPLLPESGIHRCITSISETPAELKTGKGLGSRGTASISFSDFIGDPNKDAPAVDATVISQGTFFGKLDARQVMKNRDCRIKNYRVEVDGSVDLLTGAETRYYITKDFTSGKNGTWSMSLKDELSVININETVWPIPLEGSLRSDINDSTTTIPVDALVTYVVGDSIRTGDEFMKVTNVANIGTGIASLTVQTRGTPIVYTNTLTLTGSEAHSSGDEVYVCEISDDERIDDLLERILLDIGIDASFIPKTDWTAEVDEWHPTTRINTLWYESVDTLEVLEDILTNFMFDMWFDPVAREIKLSAISVWKQSSSLLTEGNEINFESIARSSAEELRSTRAFITYNKPILATSDSIENYKKASLFKRDELEVSDLYGKPKVKRFELTRLPDKDAADLLVNRWVNRFINPSFYSWVTPEKKRTFEVGDIVDLQTSITVGFNGISTATARAQIVSIKPKYTSIGREYNVKALAYEPVFADGSEIVISGTVGDINLYIQYAGAPSEAVTITFIFDGATSGSSSNTVPSIKAGAFPTGSKVIIIMANGADLQAKGGDGGNGGSWGGITYFSPTNGTDGGVVYDAEGVDTDVYFSGATPSAAYPVADGYIRAPEGGDGGIDGVAPDIGGDGGDGGDGRSIGIGGLAGAGIGGVGSFGANGSETGPNWGVVGANNNAAGGLAGSGVVDSGATVVFFGDTPTRYINGNGDH
jgi:hypothetical protein